MTISTAGTLVQDLRVINADIQVNAANVTLRRVEIQGGSIFTNCAGNLLIQDTSIVRSPNIPTNTNDDIAIGPGSYTAIRVKIDGVVEGFRLGDKNRCGRATIIDSFARVAPPDQCGDWHGDALQGYQGPAVTVRHSTFVMTQFKPSPCEGTSPFFYPNQGNTSVDLQDVLAVGGRWFAFRLGTPGSVRNLLVASAPGGVGGGVEVTSCSSLSVWQARRATVTSTFQPTPGATIPCGN